MTTPSWLNTANLTLVLLMLTLAMLPLADLAFIPLVLMLPISLALLWRLGAQSAQPLLWLYAAAVAAMALPLLINSAWHLYPLASIEDALRLLLLGLALVALFYYWQRQQSWLVFCWFVLLLLLLWSVDALWQLYSGTSLLGKPYNGHRLTGVFHPNMRLGNMSAHWLPFAVEAVRLTVAGRWRRAPLWLLLLPILAIIFFSGDRAAWMMVLAFVALYGLVMVIRRPKSWVWLLAFVLLGIAVLKVAIEVSPATERRWQQTTMLLQFDAQSFDRASSGRGTLWRGAWHVSKENYLVGVGSNALAKQVSQSNWQPPAGYGFSFTHAHLYGLDVLLHSGILGLFYYALLLLLLLGLLIRAIGMQHHWSQITLIAALVALMPLNTHWGIFSARASMQWMLLLAMALATAQSLWTSRKAVETALNSGR